MTTDNVKAEQRIRQTGLLADLNVVDVYGEWTVRNDCGRTVFVLAQNGSVQTVLSTKCTGYNRGVTITEMARSTFDMTPQGYYKQLNDTSNRPYNTYVVSTDQLSRGPVYIPQMGIAIGYDNDDNLRKAHPFVLGEGSLQNVLVSRVGSYEKSFTSVICSINTYDESVNEVYTILNGGIVMCQVTHDTAMPERVVLSTVVKPTEKGGELVSTLFTKSETGKLDREALTDHSFETSDGVSWSFSTDKSVLVEKLKQKRLQDASKFDASEVELKIKQRVEEVETSKNELEKQLELLQKKVKNLEEELNQRNNEARKTHEEKMCEMKLGIAKQEQELKEQKFEHEKSLLDMQSKECRRKSDTVDRQAAYDKFAFEQKMMMEHMQQETDRIKAASDLEIAKAKVETAQIAKSTAATAETSGMFKSAAVIVPAAIALGVSAFTLKAATTASSIIASANPVTAPIALAAASTAMLAKTEVGKNILSNASSIIKNTAKIMMSGTTKAASVLSRFASSIYEKTKHLAKSIFDSGRSAVKSVCRGTKSIIDSGRSAVKTVYEGAKSIVSSGVSAVKSAYEGTKSLFRKASDTILSWFW